MGEVSCALTSGAFVRAGAVLGAAWTVPHAVGEVEAVREAVSYGSPLLTAYAVSPYHVLTSYGARLAVFVLAFGLAPRLGKDTAATRRSADMPHLYRIASVLAGLWILGLGVQGAVRVAWLAFAEEEHSARFGELADLPGFPTAATRIVVGLVFLIGLRGFRRTGVVVGSAPSAIDDASRIGASPTR